MMHSIVVGEIPSANHYVAHSRGRHFKSAKAKNFEKAVAAQLACDFGSFTDPRDGREYKTVKIGRQVWMAENLSFDYKGAKAYNNDPANREKYGLLYDWETAMKACPSGWRLPSNKEWDELMRFADGDTGTNGPYDSKTAGGHLKSTSGWNKDGNGADKYGFSALPGGFGYSDGRFDGVGNYGYWWSSNEGNASGAYYRYMSYSIENAYWYYRDKSYLFSVRCVKDGGGAV